MDFTRSSKRPPHCPNSSCDSHSDPTSWRFSKKGFFLRQRRPRRVQRYRCQRCGRSFSDQTFSATYWLKRPELLRRLFQRSVACSANRQIAREFRVAHTTVQRQLARLGRHCLLLHEALRPRGVPLEPLVLDGLRTFESGHYWPFDLNLLVGAESHFIYGFSEAELRRGGSMRPQQRRKRARLEGRFGRADPRATRKSVEELVRRVVPHDTAATIRSDEHRAYPLAFRRLATSRRILHETTPSRAPRTPANPLFPVNLADLLIRHSASNHKRETIAFSKRRQGAMNRMAIFAVWRNYVKSVSERRRDAPPGVRLGRVARALRLHEVVGPRLFRWRFPLRGWLAECYAGRIPTRRLRGGRDHRLHYAE